MSKCMNFLSAATTAIRDQYVGFPDDEIVAPSGKGINTLLRDLVTYLRESGVDDEGCWDCDATKGIAVRKPPTFEPFTLVVEARPISEYGEGPNWAEFTVTPQLVDRLIQLSLLCEENGLESVTVNEGPDLWEQEDELRIRGNTLRVYGSDFWFEAHPKHADYYIETVSIDVGDLASVSALSTEVAGFRRVGDKVFYAGDEDSLDGLIALYEGGACDECGCDDEEVIGCPDGAEICQSCFDAGQH